MRTFPSFEGFARRLFGLIAPGSCAACGEPPEPAFGFCPTCGPPLSPARGALGDVPILAAGAYAPPLANAILRYKYGGRRDLAAPLARLLLPRLAELDLRDDDACLPVPLHRARLVERGFNQSALLARALARNVGARFEPRLLERHQSTEQQARLGREERAENTFGAFGVRRRFRGGRVILVDDVVTTGATASGCLRALREAKIPVLAVVALAHGSARSC